MSEQNKNDGSSTSRNPSALLALIAGIAAPGLGYVYVGRIRIAFVPFIAVFGTLAIAGWTRLILEPAGLYIAYMIGLLVWLVSIVHPAIIAYTHDELPARSFNRGWVYGAWIVSATLFGGFLVDHRGSLFGYGQYRIPANSMAPTLQRNDLVIADTWRFRRSVPASGELVVFTVPDNPGIKYVSRIVGLPGDKIELREDVLFRNGQAVREDFIQLTHPSSGLGDFGPVTVPDEHFFVLGDNRHNARDSRFIGPIHKDLLHGRVEHRWFARDGGISWSRFPVKFTANPD